MIFSLELGSKLSKMTEMLDQKIIAIKLTKIAKKKYIRKHGENARAIRSLETMGNPMSWFEVL